MLKSLRNELVTAAAHAGVSGKKLDSRALDLALRRNFGGKPKLLETTVAVFRKHCFEGKAGAAGAAEITSSANDMENSEARARKMTDVADDDGNLYYSDVAPLVYPTKSGEAIAILRSHKHRVRYGFHAARFFSSPQKFYPRLLGAIGMKSILQATSPDPAQIDEAVANWAGECSLKDALFRLGQATLMAIPASELSAGEKGWAVALDASAVAPEEDIMTYEQQVQQQRQRRQNEHRKAVAQSIISSSSSIVF